MATFPIPDDPKELILSANHLHRAYSAFSRIPNAQNYSALRLAMLVWQYHCQTPTDSHTEAMDNGISIFKASEPS